MNLDALLDSPAVVLGIAAVAGMIFVIAVAAGVRSFFSGRNDVVDRLGRPSDDDFDRSSSRAAPPRQDLAKTLALLLKPFSFEQLRNAVGLVQIHLI